MSKCLIKVKNVKLLSIFVAAILAIAVALGIVCGVQGNGVFNTSALLKDSNTLTISLSNYAYASQMDELEEYCEDAFEQNDVSYKYVMKGEMTGADSEVVYVFGDDVDLEKVKTDLQNKFDNLKEGAWNGALVKVAVNSGEVVSVLARGYIVRGIIAAVVLAVLVFAYTLLRHNLNMAATAGIGTLLGTALTVALAIITRIPVTTSVAYVIAAGALLTAIVITMNLNKLRANENKEYATAAEYVSASIAAKEIVILTALLGVAIILVGAIATATVRWFAILALLAVVVAAFMGLVYVPALYLPLKEIADKKPNKEGYIGAQKTSTRIKKIFTKKAKKVEVPAEEAPVEAPAEEVAPAEEAPVEEAAESPVEEVPAEETTEAPVEEDSEEEKVEEDE